jgi:hypothetical protein
LANYRAIATAGAALIGLIRDRYPRPEFGIGLEIDLYQTRNFETPMLDGFSVQFAGNGSELFVRLEALSLDEITRA